MAKTFRREDDCEALQGMASCRSKDAEGCLQKVLKKFDLTLTVPFTYITCATDFQVPVLMPDDFIKVLHQRGFMYKLVGGSFATCIFICSQIHQSFSCMYTDKSYLAP